MWIKWYEKRMCVLCSKARGDLNKHNISSLSLHNHFFHNSQDKAEITDKSISGLGGPFQGPPLNRILPKLSQVASTGFRISGPRHQLQCSTPAMHQGLSRSLFLPAGSGLLKYVCVSWVKGCCGMWSRCLWSLQHMSALRMCSVDVK